MFTGQNRGTTLVEAIVGSGLLLLITGAFAFVLSSIYRYQERVEARLELNQQALLTISRISSELSESNLATIPNTDPNTLIFCSPRNLSGDLQYTSGQLGFASLICYRLQAVGGGFDLLRQREGFPVVPRPPDPATMTPIRDLGYFAGSSLPARTVAQNVTLFEIERLKSVDDVIKVKIGLKRDAGGREFRITVDSAVEPKN